MLRTIARPGPQIVPPTNQSADTAKSSMTYSTESESRLKLWEIVMDATLSPPATSSVARSHVSQCAHWRQVKRYSTVENAEQEIARLRAKGIHASLSMVDGLCVLAPTNKH